MTKEDLARRTGKNTTFISDLEGGREKISEDFAGLLADIFGINAKILLG